MHFPAEFNMLKRALREAHNEPVEAVVNKFFSGIIWSPLKDEFDSMTPAEKAALYTKLETVR